MNCTACHGDDQGSPANEDILEGDAPDIDPSHDLEVDRASMGRGRSDSRRQWMDL